MPTLLETEGAAICAPTREGWWRWENDIEEPWNVEVYPGPNGELCVWCMDVGVSHYSPVASDSDEMLGHMQCHIMGGRWTSIAPPGERPKGEFPTHD